MTTKLVPGSPAIPQELCGAAQCHPHVPMGLCLLLTPQALMPSQHVGSSRLPTVLTHHTCTSAEMSLEEKGDKAQKERMERK